MSAPTTTAPSTTAPAPAGTGPKGAERGWWRRHRAMLVVGTGAVLAVALAGLLGGGPQSATPMDPDNPGRDGARALARVLSRDGVDVTVARGADALDQARIDADTTVLVVRPSQLGRSTINRLAHATTRAATVVVAGAGPGTVAALGVNDAPEQVAVGRGRAADCDDPRFDGLRLEVDRAVGYPKGECFGGRAHGRSTALVSQPENSSVLTAPLVLFGADQALTNGQVLRADNAAVALRLLGQQPHLVWYVPSVDDLVGDDGVSLQSLLPPWIRPGLWVVGSALAGLVLWRVRRLGPLATEPLPVVVRAIETTHSRGRLYRRAGDRGHAAEALRRAARARLSDRLRLGSAAAPEVVVREVARRTGRRGDELARLLGPRGDVPSTDRDLIMLAERLAELDDEVSRT